MDVAFFAIKVSQYHGEHRIAQVFRFGNFAAGVLRTRKRPLTPIGMLARETRMIFCGI